MLSSSINVYSLLSYDIAKKKGVNSRPARQENELARRQAAFAEKGVRRTVQGVLLVHQHGFPCVLVLHGPSEKKWSLPGGRLRPGEEERSGLQRKLNSRLRLEEEQDQVEWEIGEVLATWFRPEFLDYELFPYCPPHISQPKEVRTVFLVRLPENLVFHHNADQELVAVPLFSLERNSAQYGPVISSLPEQLSRFTINTL